MQNKEILAASRVRVSARDAGRRGRVSSCPLHYSNVVGGDGRKQKRNNFAFVLALREIISHRLRIGAIPLPTETEKNDQMKTTPAQSLADLQSLMDMQSAAEPQTKSRSLWVHLGNEASPTVLSNGVRLLADARLIAAAPELAAALRDLLAAHEPFARDGRFPTLAERDTLATAQDSARAALAKLESEAVEEPAVPSRRIGWTLADGKAREFSNLINA